MCQSSKFLAIPSFTFTRLLIFLHVLTLVSATPRNFSQLCTWQLGYSPFQTWTPEWLEIPNSPITSNTVCWYFADCVFSQVPDTRKQQFAATSLVMGLIPLILKDIAWPHRRVALIPKDLPWATEILVRALGLNPVVSQGANKATYGKKYGKWPGRAILMLLVGCLCVAFASLALVERYSKRSSLGCVYPVFVLSWFIIALLPAVIEVGRYRWRRKQKEQRPALLLSAVSDTGARLVAAREGVEYEDNARAIGLRVGKPEPASDGIQGAQEVWWIQFAWAVYYTAGTLIYTSIMCVAVIELFVWVVVSCATAASSKLLAYKLCGYWGRGW